MESFDMYGRGDDDENANQGALYSLCQNAKVNFEMCV